MIVLELCQNGALREVIKSDPPWHMLIQLALDIVHGLLWLHENHIVHRYVCIYSLRHLVYVINSSFTYFFMPINRDIKTTNVLIDENFRAKLCDFSFCCHDTATSKHEFIYGTGNTIQTLAHLYVFPPCVFKFNIRLILIHHLSILSFR